jgi:hypothetical protein
MWTDLVACTFIALVVSLPLYVIYYFVRMIFTHKEGFKFSHGIKTKDIFSPVAQEDTRDAATRKRVAESIERQWEQLSARALKAHAADCPDPWTCKRNPCFKWEPDKIVSKPYEVEMKKSVRVIREDQWKRKN